MTSDVFLTTLRVTDNQDELNATMDMINKEIAQLVRCLVHIQNNCDIIFKTSPVNSDVPQPMKELCSERRGASQILDKSVWSIHVFSSIPVYKGIRLKSKIQLLEHNQLQHSHPVIYIVTQQYSSATFVSVRCHSCKGKFRTYSKIFILLGYFFLNCVSLNLPKYINYILCCNTMNADRQCEMLPTSSDQKCTFDTKAACSSNHIVDYSVLPLERPPPESSVPWQPKNLQ